MALTHTAAGFEFPLLDTPNVDALQERYGQAGQLPLMKHLVAPGLPISAPSNDEGVATFHNLSWSLSGLIDIASDVSVDRGAYLTYHRIAFCTGAATTGGEYESCALSCPMAVVPRPVKAQWSTQPTDPIGLSGGAGGESEATFGWRPTVRLTRAGGGPLAGRSIPHKELDVQVLDAVHCVALWQTCWWVCNVTYNDHYPPYDNLPPELTSTLDFCVAFVKQTTYSLTCDPVQGAYDGLYGINSTQYAAFVSGELRLTEDDIARDWTFCIGTMYASRQWVRLAVGTSEEPLITGMQGFASSPMTYRSISAVYFQDVWNASLPIPHTVAGPGTLLDRQAEGKIRLVVKPKPFYNERSIETTPSNPVAFDVSPSVVSSRKCSSLVPDTSVTQMLFDGLRDGVQPDMQGGMIEPVQYQNGYAQWPWLPQAPDYDAVKNADSAKDLHLARTLNVPPDALHYNQSSMFAEPTTPVRDGSWLVGGPAFRTQAFWDDPTARWGPTRLRALDATGKAVPNLAVRLEVLNTAAHPDFAPWAQVFSCGFDSSMSDNYDSASGVEPGGFRFRACKTDAEGRVTMELVPLWGTTPLDVRRMSEIPASSSSSSAGAGSSPSTTVMAEALTGAGWGEFVREAPQGRLFLRYVAYELTNPSPEEWTVTEQCASDVFSVSAAPGIRSMLVGVSPSSWSSPSEHLRWTQYPFPEPAGFDTRGTASSNASEANSSRFHSVEGAGGPAYVLNPTGEQELVLEYVQYAAGGEPTTQPALLMSSSSSTARSVNTLSQLRLSQTPGYLTGISSATPECLAYALDGGGMQRSECFPIVAPASAGFSNTTPPSLFNSSGESLFLQTSEGELATYGTGL